MDRVDIQNRVARLYNDRLLPIIDSHLNVVSQLGRTDKIERLEIDLGKLHVSRLEKDLLERIEGELEAKLARIMKDQEVATDEENDQEINKGSDIELLIYFLQTGTFPWWAVETTATAFEQAFENVARDKPAQLRRLLSHLLQYDKIVQRCVYACSEKTLTRIVEVCFPLEAGRLIHEQQIFRSTHGIHWIQSGLRQIWWYSVIRSVVLTHSETKMDLVPEIVRLFMRLAGLRMHEVQANSDSVDFLKGGQKLYESRIDAESTGLQNESEERQEREVVNELAICLGKLSTVLASTGSLLSTQELQEIVERLNRIEEDFASYRSQDKHTVRKGRLDGTLQELGEVQKIFGLHIDSSDYSQLKQESTGAKEDQRQLSAYRPQSTNAEAVTHKLLDEVLSAIEKINGAFARLLSTVMGTAKKDETTTAGVGDRMQKQEKQPWRRPAKDISQSQQLYDSFSDSDKVYIQNAGLVLLWPFLNRFFNNLGLSDDKAFTDEDAVERACLILQYLVAGDTENFFEAQLPLNKIICGLDLYQPVNTQWIVEADEKELADGLLEAVIQNAPLWKNLSLEGFRQAWLRRDGILGTRDGHWLLQVKRETYDIMMDRLPWTIQIVKFPWMEHLIFVEWQQS